MIRKPLLVVLSTPEGGLWLIFGRVTLLRPRNYFHHKDTYRFYKFLYRFLCCFLSQHVSLKLLQFS